MEKRIILIIILGSSLLSCNQPKKDDTTSTPSGGFYEKDKLIGKWLQPIEGMENEKQGFELSEDGAAASLNMHTLLYENWHNSHDTLFLTYRTQGVKLISKGIDTLIIKKQDNDMLVVSPAGVTAENKQTYMKEK